MKTWKHIRDHLRIFFVCFFESGVSEEFACCFDKLWIWFDPQVQSDELGDIFIGRYASTFNKCEWRWNIVISTQ